MRRISGTSWIFQTVLACIPAAMVAAGFAFRPGEPGLRHDWIWPGQANEFVTWFFNGMSPWTTQGYGAPNPSPAIDPVLGFFAAAAWAGASSQFILFAFVTIVLVAAQMFCVDLFRAIGADLDEYTAWLLGAAYAYGPVAFQKFVAGHLFYSAAYAMLPLFAASIWRLCRERRWNTTDVALAALACAVASTQIQFLFFCAFIAVVALIANRPSSGSALGVAAVLCIAALHQLTPLVGATNIGTPLLAQVHATRQWEYDLSSRWFDVLVLGGYQGYDRQALAAGPLTPFAIGRAVLALAALAGSIVAVLNRSYRAAGIAFFVIGLLSSFVASGWYGPFSTPFDFLMTWTPLFTLIRELYHAMAPYALALVVLASIALARVPFVPRIAIAAASALVALPFITGGLPRLVPAVPTEAFTQASCPSGDGLAARLPQWEPVAFAGASDHLGLDPARAEPGSIGGTGIPLAVRAALDMPHGSIPALADLGVGCVVWRPGIASGLPQMFERGTGASFDAFQARERQLAATYASPTTLPNARPLVALEAPDGSLLDEVLPGSERPPGNPAPLSSSFDDNDIRKSWVSLANWAWLDPKVAFVAGAPVVTRSSAPLEVALAATHPEWVYALIAGPNPRAAFYQSHPATQFEHMVVWQPGQAVGSPANSPYRWFRWHTNTGDPVHLALPSGGAVALVILSEDETWRLQEPRPRAAPPAVVAVTSTWWAITGTLPALPGRRHLVLRQNFSPNWELAVGKDGAQSAQLTHGLFNGWEVGPTSSPQTFAIFFGLQRIDTVANVLGNLPLLACCLWLVYAGVRSLSRPPASRELDAYKHA